jgi:hypothetical protein
MTQEAGNALRESLNKIDREHKKTTWLTLGLLLMMLAQWGAMILAPDFHKAFPWGLSAVMTSVFVAWILTVRIFNANTQAILKAIELSGKNQAETNHER